MSLRAGEPAPDFTLPSTAGVDVALSGLRGRQNVLLALLGDRRDDAELLRVIASL